MKKGKNGKKKSATSQDPEGAPTRQSHRKKNKVLSKKNRSEGPDPDQLLRQAVEGDGTRKIIDIDADGNCLFRSISDQLYHDHGAKHVEVRQDICDFIEGHSDEFSVFLVLDDDDASDEDASDFETYLYNMRRDGYWGGNLELVAAARMYGRNITVFSGGLDALTISHGNTQIIAASRDLQVSYHDEDHYNSVRDNKMTEPPPPPIRTFRKVQKDFDEVLVDEDHPELSNTAPEPSAQSDRDEQLEVGGKSEKKQVIKKGQCPCGSGKKQRKCCASRAKKVAAKKLKEEESNNESEEEDARDMDGEFRVLHI